MRGRIKGRRALKSGPDGDMTLSIYDDGRLVGWPGSMDKRMEMGWAVPNLEYGMRARP